MGGRPADADAPSCGAHAELGGSRPPTDVVDARRLHLKVERGYEPLPTWPRLDTDEAAGLQGSTDLLMTDLWRAGRVREPQAWRRRRSFSHLRYGTERLDDAGGEAAGSREPGGTRQALDAPVSHEHEDQVVGDEARSQPAALLGTSGKFANRARYPLSFGGEVHDLGEGSS